MSAIDFPGAISTLPTGSTTVACAEVDILHAGWTLQSPVAHSAFQGAILAPVPLAVDEQAEPLFKAQLLQVGTLLLFAESLGHCFEFESAEFLACWLCQHGSSFPSLQSWWVARVKVVGTAQIGVIQRRFESRLGLGFRAGQMALQNPFQALLGAGVERDGTARLRPRRVIWGIGRRAARCRDTSHSPARDGAWSG